MTTYAAAALTAILLQTEPTAPPRFELDITVETAARVEEPLDEVALSVTVIGPAEIEAAGASHVAELLRRVAGVDVTRAGTTGKLTTVRIDGATSGQTLVLLDGVELNSPTLGVADLADLTLDDVERIEIVRGPMSALYGSDAMGGVVNVISRRGTGKPEVTAMAEGGAFGTFRAVASSRGAISEAVGYSFAVARHDASGRIYDGPAGPVENDDYANTTLSGGLTAELGDASVAFDARWIDAERGLPIEVFGSQVFDVNSRQADRMLVFSGKLRAPISASVTPRLRFGVTDARQEFADLVDPGEQGPFAGDVLANIDTLRLEADAGVEASLGAANRLVAGVEWERRTGRNIDNFGGGQPNFDESVDTISFYAQDRLRLDSAFAADDLLVVTGGLRVDDVESFGTTVNPKIAALWTAPGGLFRLRGAAGRGFRAPSLNELLFPFFGNPDLEPEVARTYELAIGGRGLDRRLDLELRLFRTDYDDLITIDPESFSAINLDRARVTGAGLETRYQASDALWLRGSYTWQKAEDRDSGERLLRRPRHKGAITVAWDQADIWRLALDLIATGEQRDVPVAEFAANNPAWWRVDLAGGWTLPFASRRLQLIGRVENLFDEQYSEITGFPAPGINAYAGVKATF